MRIIYGINPILEALKSHAEDFQDILLASEGMGKGRTQVKALAVQKGVKVRVVAKEEIDRLTQTLNHQGVAAVLSDFKYADVEDILSTWRSSGEKAFILILDCIQDPQNLGSLIRSAHAAGVHGVIIPKDRAAQVTPAADKASAGAIELTPIARVTNIATTIEQLKENHIWVIGIEAGCEQDIYSFDMDANLALVIGSEGEGIRRLVKEKCDLCLSIPMKGKISSLNASIAGGIVMFEVLRKRLS